jgi:sugar transferase (PEP-CTERM/EpsH1 system associated)
VDPLLYLVHRIPYPPNKGDKIRSFHLLQHLAERYRVYLGTFVDTPADLQYIEPLRTLCAGMKIERINPSAARLRSLTGLLTGEALTVPYYRSAPMRRWVSEIVEKHAIRQSVVFSSAMVQYVLDMPGLRVVADFVDVDSAKWAQYADEHRWPASALYRREAARLLAFERAAAARSAACVLVTPMEVKLFASLAPEHAQKLHAIGNGVDAEYFSPSSDRSSPFAQGEKAIVFTGVMSYWPNVDAVTWFAQSAFPRILASQPQARFYIVGMDPTPAVKELGRDSRVVITGKVPDVRPYVQHAEVVVAPLRVARGVQNKVLEAMAMERPVVVSTSAAQGVAGQPGVDFETAETATEFADSVLRLMTQERGRKLGEQARLRVRRDYSWEAHLAAFGRLLATTGAAMPVEG